MTWIARIQIAAFALVCLLAAALIGWLLWPSPPPPGDLQALPPAPVQRGEITEADIPNLVIFLRLYSASEDGNLSDARPLGSLREKAIARIPG